MQGVAMASLVLEVSPAVAADFAALTEEDRRAIALAVATQVGQLRKHLRSESEHASAYDAITEQMAARAARAGLTPETLARLIDESR
jgi:hypothetical protein